MLILLVYSHCWLGTLWGLLSAPTLILGQEENDPEIPPTSGEVPENVSSPLEPGDRKDGGEQSSVADGQSALENPPHDEHMPQNQLVEHDENASPEKLTDQQVPEPTQEMPAPETREDSCNIDRRTTVSMESEGGDKFVDISFDLQGDLVDMSSTYPLSTVDELVTSPCVLPGWKSKKEALDLKACLQPQFDTGLKPEEDFCTLSRHVVTWMKQLSLTSTDSSDESWSKEMEMALRCFKTMKETSDHYALKVTTTEKTLDALTAAAKRNFEKTLQETPLGHPKREQILNAKFDGLSKWMTTRRNDLIQALEAVASSHHNQVHLFGQELKRLVTEAYNQYMKEVDQRCNLDLGDLFAELDGQVPDGIPQDPPPEEVAPPNPENVVPKDYGLKEAKSSGPTSPMKREPPTVKEESVEAHVFFPVRALKINKWTCIHLDIRSAGETGGATGTTDPAKYGCTG